MSGTPLDGISEADQLVSRKWKADDLPVVTDLAWWIINGLNVPAVLKGPLTITYPEDQPPIIFRPQGITDAPVNFSVERQLPPDFTIPGVTPPDSFPPWVPTTDPVGDGSTGGATYVGVVTEIDELVFRFDTEFSCTVFIEELGRTVSVIIPASSVELTLPIVGDSVIVIHGADDSWTIYTPDRVVYAGTVIEGSGQNYDVTLYGSLRVVSVFAPGQSPTDTLPPGSVGTVIRYGEAVYVFLPSAPPAASAMPGKVVSGTGALYEMDVYPAGVEAASVRVSAVQLQIDPFEEIPVGTWTLVVKSGANYYMQVPVWLSDE